MAVKASDTITLFDVVDIDSVTTYYKLQSSTASAPAKPTTNTPSGWTTTEPTYVDGSNNTLYTVIKTKYSDGTFEYTPVSKSSSYEAAKAAYQVTTSSTEPTDKTKIWFNTNNNMFYKYDTSNSKWTIINDVSDEILGLKGEIADSKGYTDQVKSEINKDLNEHYYTTIETDEKIKAANGIIEENYTKLVRTEVVNGNKAYEQVTELQACIERGMDPVTNKAFIMLKSGTEDGYSLKIETDRIVICKGSDEVSSWISDRFDVATIITKSLSLGKFDFIINQNDQSLSFRKVR